jgi:hypothetical protein
MILAMIMSAATPALPVAQEVCPPILQEYCMDGCADLGGWIVQPFKTMPEAMAHYLSLDELERISAFLVQPHQLGAGVLLLRRERLSDPAPRPDPESPHWKIAEYPDPFSAGTDALKVGGGIYKTNGGPSAYVLVWYEECPSGTRNRPVRR